MYKCYECGGFVEELGDMAVSDGGCVCAQKKAEESANSLQQLKAEILPLLTDALEEFSDNKFEHGRHYLEQAMAKLSAV